MSPVRPKGRPGAGPLRGSLRSVFRLRLQTLPSVGPPGPSRRPQAFAATCLSLGLWLWLAAAPLAAQTDSSRVTRELETTELDQVIEDLILNSGIEDQVDFTEILDRLEYLQEHPINLNFATREVLAELPGMTSLRIQALQQHIAQFGKLTSIYELQAIEAYPLDFVRAISPYITVTSTRQTDISPGSGLPTGPGWEEVSQGIEFELIQRMNWILEDQRGYTAPDTTFRDRLDDEGNVIGQDTSLSTRYAGSPYRVYTRLRARYRNNVSVAITAEKDPGETFTWDPGQQRYGYDFLSGHVAIGGYGWLKNLVIGDYTVQSGQGIALSRGLGFAKSAQAIRTLKMPDLGIRPYASVNENQLMRGAATTLGYGDFELTAFYSRLNLDASISALDTLADEALLASALQTSGLHRTPSELSNRRAVRETLYGGRLIYRTPTFKVGLTHYQQHFGAPLSPRPNDYNQFDFRGDYNHLSSVDVDWTVRNFNFFGELARSRSGGIGANAGLMASIAPTVDVALLFRHFDKDFHSSKAYVFAERPTAAQNETGIYFGLRFAPNPKWTFNQYFDQYYFPWNKFITGYPSSGWEYLAQLDYRIRRGTEVYARFRTETRELNADNYPSGQQLRYLVPGRRDQFRLHFTTSIERDIRLQTRIEFSHYRQAGGEEVNERGLLLYQDLSWRFRFKYRITARYALFDIPSYDARIYAYENDVLGFFFIPPYSGIGSRYYVILNWKATKGLEFWARLAQTRLRNTETIGSGLDRIEGGTRSEVKLQMRIKF